MIRRTCLRRHGLAVAIAIATLAIGVNDAAAATKDFTMTVAPGAVPAGRVAAVDVTLTNRTVQQQLGSANITPPDGFTVRSIVSLSPPPPATATVASNVVQLRTLALQPGSSATVSLTVEAPCSSTAGAWGVIAKQANNYSGSPGNDLTLDAAASSVAMTTVGVCTPCFEDISCSATLGAPGGSQAAVMSDADATRPDAGFLTMSLTGALDCPGYAERSQDTFNLDAPANRPKRATLKFAPGTRPVTGKDPLEVCYAAPVPFAAEPKTTLTTVVIDGVQHYVGRLPNCLGMPTPPCVLARDNAARSIEFVMPTGDPRYM